MVWRNRTGGECIMRGNPDDLANQELAEIYEALVGADGMERYTHAELIEYIHQLKTIEENEDELV